MKKYTVEIWETGDALKDCESLEIAEKYVRREEAIDKSRGLYTPNYYYIRNHQGL